MCKLEMFLSEEERGIMRHKKCMFFTSFPHSTHPPISENIVAASFTESCSDYEVDPFLSRAVHTVVHIQ